MSGIARDKNAVNYDLAAALGDAEERFTANNPKSWEAYEAACRAMPGGNTRTVLFYPPFPLTIARGEGCRLWDADGHRYTDFAVEQTAGLYGHSHPLIQAALREAIEGGIVLGGPTHREGALAELICARFPSIELVRFTNSGTEANMLALATARAITGRSKIMAFEGAYHGSLLSFGGGGSPLNAPLPMVMAPYNDTETTVALIEANADDLAAVILEPMCGSGGCILAEPAFLKALRTTTERRGVVLVFDEVMTSRLSPGGLQAATGVIPDMTTLGKYVGGGMSFGAFGGRTRLMERFDPRRKDSLAHAGTFNNNVMTMSAGLVGLRDIYTPEAAVALNAAGDGLRQRLNDIIVKHRVPAHFSGFGSMMMLHPTTEAVRSPVQAAALDQKAKALLHLEMIARGFYISRRGMIILSLPMAEADFDGLVAAFDDFLAVHGAVFEAAG